MLEKVVPANLKKLRGVVLNVRPVDKEFVDFALAIKVEGNYYPICYLKGKTKELEGLYLKEVEVIGIQKYMKGWTRPLIYVDSVKAIKK